jgi:hypothetical protein
MKVIYELLMTKIKELEVIASCRSDYFLNLECYNKFISEKYETYVICDFMLFMRLYLLFCDFMLFVDNLHIFLLN